MIPDTTSAPLDPALLAAFRQQAAAVVARERGFTPACRIKLAGIARSLGIADDQIEQAIGSLTTAEPSAPPNAQAERLRRRLRKDLSGKKRTIIGPTIETQIIANARRKYGLDEAVTREVVNEVTAELGLTLVTSSDAIQSLTAQIDDAIGDSSWLAREGWDRLRSAASKWGLELEIVDEMIEERLTSNRDEYLRRHYWTRLTLYGAGGAVIAACVIIAGLFLARSMKDERPAVGSSATSTFTPRRRSTGSPPSWWSVDLAVEMANAKKQLGGLGGASQLIASADANERAAGYERLIEQVKDAPKNRELLSTAATIVAACHALEPDENAASRLRAALLSLLPAADQAVPSDAAHFNLCFWACDTALAQRGGTAERAAQLSDALSIALSGSFDTSATRAEQERAIRGLTVLAAYRQLTAAATKEPVRTAALYPIVAERGRAVLPDDEILRAETTLLVAALPAAGAQWKVYERALARCISSPEPLYSLRLLDVLRRATDRSLVAELTELLIVRAGVRPKTRDKKDVVAAVRQALGGGGNSALAIADRWLALREEAETALSRPLSSGDEEQVLSRAVHLAHYTTLAIALAQGEAGLATFDAGIAQRPALPAPKSASESSSDERLDKAAELFAQSYRQRCSLLNAVPSAVEAAQSPGQAAELMLATMVTGRVKNDDFASRLPMELKAARYLASSDLQYTVALQRLLIELTAHRAAADRPQKAASARQIAAEAMAASATAGNALAQLQCHEAGLLKLWLLYAPEA
jgi:hypothetical protein